MDNSSSRLVFAAFSWNGTKGESPPLTIFPPAPCVRLATRSAALQGGIFLRALSSIAALSRFADVAALWSLGRSRQHSLSIAPRRVFLRPPLIADHAL